MLSNYVKQAFLFIFLVLLQVLVLSQISFLTYAIPFLYIYFIIQLPIGLNRNLVLLLAFLLGFSVDIFCNTTGVNAAATVFVAFARQPIQGMFFSRADFEHLAPKISSVGATAFIGYATVMIVLHHTALILIESFSMLNVSLIVLRILYSSILTLVLVLGIEGFSTKRKK